MEEMNGAMCGAKGMELPWLLQMPTLQGPPCSAIQKLTRPSPSGFYATSLRRHNWLNQRPLEVSSTFTLLFQRLGARVASPNPVFQMISPYPEAMKPAPPLWEMGSLLPIMRKISCAQWHIEQGPRCSRDNCTCQNTSQIPFLLFTMIKSANTFLPLPPWLYMLQIQMAPDF